MFELRKLFRCAVSTALVLSISAMSMDTSATNADPSLEIQRKLLKGEVVVDQKVDGETKYVVGRVLINHPPDQVWPIMTNPYEYEGKICPRMKELHIIQDRDRSSLMSVRLDCGFFLPDVQYVVASKYEPNNRIDFQRVSGTIRDFKGCWEIHPLAQDPTKTELSYTLYIDPGFFVPQWVVREGVKGELPRTLISLRKRVDAVYSHHAPLEKRSILAAAYKHLASTAHHHHHLTH